PNPGKNAGRTGATQRAGHETKVAPGLICFGSTEGRVDRVITYIREHRLRYGAAILILLVIEGYAMFTQLASTTAISTERAVEEFRSLQAEVAAAQPEQPPTAEGEAPGQAVVSPVPHQPNQGKNAQAPSTVQCEWACVTTDAPPENGVYEYFQCGRTSGQCTGEESEPQGMESFGGSLSRPLPRKGQRILSGTGRNTWNNIHIYAEEHREEFDLSFENNAVLNHRYKVEIKIGPVTGGSEMKMQPPLRFSQFPMTVGMAWNGSFTDLNRNADADYACQVVGKEEMKILTARVKTWVVDCKLTMKGPKTKGYVNLRFWVSPDQRNTIQELYDQSLETEQGPYTGKWMVTLANVKPKT
ncbi:MAG: hypothetical protein ACRD1T_21805, partial [Acidimicrobiia bacterium]